MVVPTLNDDKPLLVKKVVKNPKTNHNQPIKNGGRLDFEGMVSTNFGHSSYLPFVVGWTSALGKANVMSSPPRVSGSLEGIVKYANHPWDERYIYLPIYHKNNQM